MFLLNLAYRDMPYSMTHSVVYIIQIYITSLIYLRRSWFSARCASRINLN